MGNSEDCYVAPEGCQRFTAIDSINKTGREVISITPPLADAQSPNVGDILRAAANVVYCSSQ